MPHINYFTKELEILNKRIFFSRELNIMFLTTPKCGSQFTKLFCLLNLIDDLSKSAFQQTLFIDQEQHSSNNKNVVEDYFRKWANNNPVNIDDLNNSSIKKYQIVRDPYKRLISFISSNLNKLGDSDDSPILNKCVGKDKLFTEQYLLRSIIKYLKEPHQNVSEFSGKINIGYYSLYEHLFPQHDWLFSKYFQPIKLEDLDEFLKDNYDYIIPKKQNFKHHTQHKFESKLDQETKDQIYELFRDDFINFNYEK